MWSVFPAWGFLSPGRIFSRPGDVTIHYLQTHCAGQSVYLLGVPALRQSFAEAGISLTEEQPDLVVVGFDKTLTYERLEKACIYLRRGAPFPRHPPRYQLPH